MRREYFWSLTLAAFLCTSSMAAPFQFIGPSGGHIKSITYLEQGLLIAGSYNGRLFLTLDYGKKWTDITPSSLDPEMVIEQLVFHTPTRNIYIGIRSLSSGSLLCVNLDQILAHHGKWSTILSGVPVRSIAMTNEPLPEIFVGTEDTLYYSKDAGMHWQVSLFSFPDPQIESVIIDPIDSRVIYAGTWQRCYKSTDKGKNWQPIHAGMAPDSDVFCMQFDPIGNLFAGTCGYAYLSTNRGLSWKKIQDGLKGKRVHSLEPDHLGHMIAGTNTGLYLYNQDIGKWIELIPDIVIHDTAMDEKGRIYCATEGEAVIRYERDKPDSVTFLSGIYASSPKIIHKSADHGLMVSVMYQNSASGLWSLKDGDWKRIPSLSHNTNIWDFVDLKEMMFIGSDKGLTLINKKTQKSQTIEIPSKQSVKRILYSREKNILLTGTFKGLFWIDPVKRYVTAVEALKDANVNAIWMPADNPTHIYTGTEQGLYVYSFSHKIWRPIDLKIDHLTINAICGDPDGQSVIIGTNKGIFSIRDHGRTVGQLSKNLPQEPCLDVQMSRGTVFALFKDNSLHYKPDTETSWNQIRKFPFPVWSMYLPDDEDTIYLGSKGFGLVKLPRNTDENRIESK